MPRKMPYEREMKKRYPPRYYTNAQEAENYKSEARGKGLNYHVHEHRGAFIVDEPVKGTHPYWRSTRRKQEPEIKWYDEEGREI